MEIYEMSIMINLFLVAYLLAMVLVTILGVIWILTAITSPEWLAKAALLIKYQKNNSDEIR
jgi:type IV secretory pathway TrbL component